MHAIDTTTGTAAMAYVGQTPWHGLGQELVPGQDLDTWAKAAGMDFKLKSAPLYWENGGKNLFPGKVAIYRDDTHAPLSVASNKYKIVQPREVLEFFDKWVNGVAELETAGVLHEGRQYWAMAKLDGEINVAGDITKPYLLLSSSADGSLPTAARLTSVRVVCNNTLSMAVRDKAVAKVSHRTVFSGADLASKLGEMHSSFKAHGEMLKTLAGIKLSADEATAVIAKLVANGQEDNIPRGYKRVLEMFATSSAIGSEAESANGTAYGLLQSATQYFDWEFGRQQDTRLFNAWFGPNANVKSDLAESLVLALA